MYVCVKRETEEKRKRERNRDRIGGAGKKHISEKVRAVNLLTRGKRTRKDIVRSSSIMNLPRNLFPQASPGAATKSL